MNVRMEQSVEFLAGVYKNKQLTFNKFYVKLELMTNTPDNLDQNIALDRLRYLITFEFSNCLFINKNDAEAIEKFEQAGLHVIAVPEVPVDQIIGITLFYKLNAILEDRVIVQQVSTVSEAGIGITYLHSFHESIDMFEEPGWWNDPTPQCVDKKWNNSNVVDMRKNITWHSLDLHWHDDNDDNDRSGNVVEFKLD